jgi:hypothetical protein
MNEYSGINKNNFSEEKLELIKQYEEKLKGTKRRFPLLMFYNMSLLYALSIYFRNMSFLLKKYNLNIKNSRTAFLFILFNFVGLLGVTIVPNAIILYKNPIKYFRERKRIEDELINNSEFSIETVLKALENEIDTSKIL